MSEWASTHVVIQMAMAPAGSVPWLETDAPSVSERCRSSLVRMSRQIDISIYEAMITMTEAMGQLEREIRVLRHQQRLAAVGIEFKTELIEIAADGVQLQRKVPYAVGTELQVHLDLTVWGVQHLMVLRAQVHHQDDASRLGFMDVGRDQRDTIVALVFQEQGRKRRHASSSESV